MTTRTTTVRRLAALAACSLIATVFPLSALAEQGIPAGSGAVITAGGPLLVRAVPGWDAAVSYEIADGSYVTVWDVAQAAPDGSMWYPVDGGFVPVDSVTSTATLDGGIQLYQNTATEDWAEPVTEEWTDPAAAQGWVDPNTGEWIDATATQGWVDPNTGEWVDPNATQPGWVDPSTTEWVDPNTGQWVDQAATQGWIDPNTGEWVSGVEPAQDAAIDDSNAAPLVDPDAASADAAADAGGWIDPNTGEWVAATPADDASVTESWTETAPTDATTGAARQEWVEPVNTAASGDSYGVPIGTAYIAGTNGDGAVCRVAADGGSERLAVLGEGEAVEVRGEAAGEWQPVNCAGIGGYVNTAFISWEPAAATVELEQRKRNRNRDENGNGGANAGVDGSSSSSGDQIANFASQFVGYPYVYAGEGPNAFDCSGFTKYVIQNTLGIDITHDMFAQYDMGQKVDRSELQPGDLVFFQNTFRPGMSHNGIYLGGGQFVHAENEQTGVKVSDLNADYYSSRWYGAVRLS